MTNQTAAALQKLTKDIKLAASTLSKREARYLVDLYYQLQDARIRSAAQVRAIAQGADEGSTHETLSFFFDQFESLESQIKRALGEYARSHRPGRWMQSICGIGDVISAGLLAHIDIEKAPHVGHIWKFAGIASPAVDKWNKGEKRPWNADLKTLAVFKLGESFVKVQNREADFYGKLFAERKALYTAKNEAGDFADEAARVLENRKIGKATDAYKAYSEGRLPKAHIHARARRYAVKMFLSHLHEVMYEDRYGQKPAKPWIIDIGGHADYISVPNWPID